MPGAGSLAEYLNPGDILSLPQPPRGKAKLPGSNISVAEHWICLGVAGLKLWGVRDPTLAGHLESDEGRVRASSPGYRQTRSPLRLSMKLPFAR